MSEVEGRFDVFISHASPDAGHATALREALEAEGYRCFVAASDLSSVVGTKQWGERLEKLLAATPILVVVVTPEALSSKWVAFEWRSFHEDILAGRRAGLLVPVLCSGLVVSALPAALRHWQVINVFELANERGLQELLRLVAGYRDATLSSSDALERKLLWSEPPEPTFRSSLDPSTESSARPSIRGKLSQRGILAAVAGLLLAGGARFIQHYTEKPVLPELGPHPATLSAKSSKSTPPESPSPPRPRRGWEPIEAYLRPTLDNRNTLSRAETWMEAAAAFDEACTRGCSARNAAAGHFARGERARLAGDLPSARDAFDRALRADPGWALPLVGRASTNVDQDPARALDDAREAYRRDDALWIALTVKAAAFSRRSALGEAAQEALEARKRAPPECVPGVDGLLSVVYHAEGAREERALELARAVCTPKDRVAAACVVLAEHALERRDADAAIRFAELADRDDYVPLLLALGDAFQLKNDFKRAWPAWRRAVALKPRAEGQGTPRRRLALIETAVATNHPPPRRGTDRTVSTAASPSTSPTSPTAPTLDRTMPGNLYGERR